MQITLDTRAPPSGPRGSGGGSKLIDRIGKPPLSERLSNPRVETSDGPGPVRSRTPKGGRGRGGMRDSSSGTPSAKTLADLDKELEAFMGDGDAKPAAETTAPAEADVAMS